MSWAAAAGFTAATLLVVSFLVLRGTKYKEKRADHMARTFAQTGVGIGSVAVAISIFQMQLHEQDVRQFRQAALAASATLKSITAAVSLDVEELLPARSYLEGIDCAPPRNCLDTESSKVHMRRLLRLLKEPDPRKRRFFIEGGNYAERLRSVMAAHSVFGAHAIKYMLAVAYQYDVRLIRSRMEVQEIVASLPAKEDEWDELSRDNLRQVFERLAKQQKEQVSNLAAFVCEVEEIDEAITMTTFYEKVEPYQGPPRGDDTPSYNCSVRGAPPFRAILGAEKPPTLGLDKADN